METTVEIWKDIPRFVGVYQISNHGRLKSFKSNPKGKILSNVNSKGGYLSVVLRNGQFRRFTRIHILVAEAFIGEKPCKNSQVHHKNENKQINFAYNLEYLTPGEHSKITHVENPQMFDAMIYRNQNIVPIPIAQFDFIGNHIKTHKNSTEAAKFSGVCRRNILQVACNTEYKPGKTRKQAGGFIWKLEKQPSS